jgi:hypothetical protein
VCFINAFRLERRVPQGLGPVFFRALNGTAKAVPYPKPIYETRSTLFVIVLGVMPKNILRTARERWAGREQVVGDMNGEIQAAGELLAELREAYQDLPQHIRVHVMHLLRESSRQKQPRRQACELTPGTEAVISVFRTQLRNP